MVMTAEMFVGGKRNVDNSVHHRMAHDNGGCTILVYSVMSREVNSSEELYGYCRAADKASIEQIWGADVAFLGMKRTRLLGLFVQRWQEWATKINSPFHPLYGVVENTG